VTTTLNPYKKLRAEFRLALTAFISAYPDSDPATVLDALLFVASDYAEYACDQPVLADQLAQARCVLDTGVDAIFRE
jgi:hypothetical protein